MKNYIIIILLIIFTISCDRWEDIDDSKVVARVGEDYLTIDEVNSMLPDYLSNEEKNVYSEKFVESWITEQILYQTAKANNLSLTDKQKNYLNKLERSYLIGNYIDIRNLEQQKDVPFNLINNYYRKHLEDYEFDGPRIRLTQIMFETRVKDIFDEIKKTGDLNEIVKKYRLFSRPGESTVNGDLGFVDPELLNPVIRRRIRYLKVGDYTGPFTLQNKFVFVQVTDKKKKGDPIPIEFVKDEIKKIVDFQQRQEIRKQLIKEKRSNYIIETFMSRLDFGVKN